jgi:hypothetical protein
VTTRQSLAAALFGSLVLALMVLACGGGSGTRYEVVTSSKYDDTGHFVSGHVLCVRVTDPKKTERKLEVCGHQNAAFPEGIDWYCGVYGTSAQEWLGYPSVDVTDPAFDGQTQDCDRMVSVVKKSGVLSDV